MPVPNGVEAAHAAAIGNGPKVPSCLTARNPRQSFASEGTEAPRSNRA
jgi:hypothetical protein